MTTFIHSEKLEHLLSKIDPQNVRKIYYYCFSKARKGSCKGPMGDCFECVSQWDYPGTTVTREIAKSMIDLQMKYNEEYVDKNSSYFYYYMQWKQHLVRMNMQADNENTLLNMFNKKLPKLLLLM